jgi:hypothetical protein
MTTRMPTWSNYQAQQEHHQDINRAAAASRLVRRARVGDKVREPFTCRVCTWLGRRLIVWGRALLNRYGPASVAPARPSTDPVAS